MTMLRSVGLFAVMGALLFWVGSVQSWSLALAIFNLCLISSVMALGVNMQWGYAGLFNVGTMGFAAMGGSAAVLVSMAPIPAAWQAGGSNLAFAALIALAVIAIVVWITRRLKSSLVRTTLIAFIVLIGLFAYRYFFDPAVEAIESVNSAQAGFLGGLGLPIVFSWIVGGVFAAGAAWIVGKVALGLRSDYLAIATLGISEIIIALMKNEDWLTRGVKNVTGLPRPVPYEVDLQSSESFASWVQWWHGEKIASLADADRAIAFQQLIVESSGLFVKLCYAGLFMVVLVTIFWLSERALRSPWGRMMRAIRDNEDAAEAMGKDVTGRHLQIFVLGSAVVGIAGAMLTTLDGQFTPGTYNPLRFTFLIWVMVIVGGSGNNLGAVLGGFLIWFVWIEAEPVGLWLVEWITTSASISEGLSASLMQNAPHMRLVLMGLLLLFALRFSPKGLIPERIRH